MRSRETDVANGDALVGVIAIDRLASIELDDELLDHVVTVVLAKLRSREPVVLRWSDPGGSVHQVFVNASCALLITYDSEDRMPLHRDRLRRLMLAANSTGGICLDAARRSTGEIPAARVLPMTGPSERRTGR